MAAEKPLTRLIQIIFISVVIAFFVLTAYLSKQDVQKADATGQYAPVGGSVVVGVNLPVNGTDDASYKAAFASDNRYWIVQNAPGGIDVRMHFDGILLNEANKLGILHEDSASSAALSYRTQMYDYVNDVWRTIDRNPHTSLTDVSMNHEIFNGFYLDASNDPINTPLTNFVSPDSLRRLQMRIISTYDAAPAVLRIDRMQMQAITETQMFAADSSVDVGGTPSLNYWYTNATDALPYSVPALAAGGVRLDHTLEFKNFVTYPGANAILVNYTGRTTDAALGIRLRIYNFSTSLWEDLNSNLLTDITTINHQFAKGNIDLDDYVQNGEIRINFYNNTYLGSSIYNHEIDRINVTIGSVTSPVAGAEVSFGSEAGGSSFLNTRDLDTSTGAPLDTWQINSAKTSINQYGLDYGGSYSTHDSIAANINFPVTIPRNAAVTGVRFAGRFKSGESTRTVRMGIRDVSTTNSAGTGGWSLVGTSNNSAGTYTYSEGVFESNQTDYMLGARGLINLRLRTTASTSTATTAGDWDFAFVSIRWTDSHGHPSVENKYTPVDGTLVTGTQDVVDGATNVGSWKGLISTDNRYWAVNNAPGGAEIQMRFNNVINNSNNKLVLTREFRVSSSDMNPIFEIYDYPNAVWRAIEPYDPSNSNVTDATEVHDIYNGYFNSSPQDPIDTPLSNFISDDQNRSALVRIRATYDIEPRKMLTDRVQLMAVSDSDMSPSKHNMVKGAYVSGIYTGTNISDNLRFVVSSDVVNGLENYFTFRNTQYMPASNALVVQYEGSVSNTALGYFVRIYNFNTASWVNLNSVALNSTAENRHGFALASIDPADYVLSSGEARVGFVNSTTPATPSRNLSIDLLKLSFGSVPVSTSSSEVSFGSQAGGSYLNTRDMDTSAAAPNTWQINTAATADQPYSFDRAGTYGTNYSAAANLNFWLEVPHGTSFTSNRLIARYRSNEVAHAIRPALRDYFGLTTVNAGGFLNVGTANASTDYTLSDIVNDNNSEDFFDYPHHTVNVNFRTTASTALSPVVQDIDFAMVSARWVHASGDHDGPYASQEGLILNTDKFGYVDPGDVYTYRHLLLNNTVINRSFTVQLESSHGWTVVASPDSGLISAGARASIDIIVTVPAGAEIGTIDVTKVIIDSPELPVQHELSYDSTSVNRDDFPHGIGEAGPGDTNSCLICHDLHESSGEYELLRQGTFTDMCSSCHNLYLKDDLYTGTGTGYTKTDYPGHPGGMAYNKPCSTCPVGSASNASVYEVPLTDELTHRGHRIGLARISGPVTYADGVSTSDKNYIPGGSQGLNRLYIFSTLDGTMSIEPATSSDEPISDPLDDPAPPPESAGYPTGTTGGLFCTSCHGAHGRTGSVLPTSVFSTGTLIGPAGRNKFLSSYPNFNTLGYGAMTSVGNSSATDIVDWKDEGGKWCVYCHDLLKPGTASANLAHRCHGYDLCLTCHGPADGSGLQDFPHAGTENLLSESYPGLCARCHTVNPTPCP